MLSVNFCPEVSICCRFLLFAALSFTHFLFGIAVFLNRCIFIKMFSVRVSYEKILDLKTAGGVISKFTKQICH